MVIWIIGKSGSGKTYLAKILNKKFNKKLRKIKLIDGDKFRKSFSQDLGYSLKDREKNSKRMQKYCLVNEKKNDLVICSILSIFQKHQKENRKLFMDYFQIHIAVSIKKLSERNNKNIYSKKQYVVGKDLSFPKPYKSDITITNNFSNSFNIKSKKIYKKIYEKINKSN
jgi:adenylylsulfate kinase-like enzyme